MKAEDLVRIEGIYQAKQTKKVRGKKYTNGPYWFGWWMENGKQIRKYIGKNLPKHLEFLLRERFKGPGRKQWTWPDPRAANRLKEKRGDDGQSMAKQKVV